MTEPNMEWEEELSSTFCVMLERAGREHGESPTDWQEKLESFIRKVETRAYEKGKAEERKRIAEKVEKESRKAFPTQKPVDYEIGYSDAFKEVLYVVNDR